MPAACIKSRDSGTRLLAPGRAVEPAPQQPAQTAVSPQRGLLAASPMNGARLINSGLHSSKVNLISDPPLITNHIIGSSYPLIKMTRSHKYNDKDHAALASGMAAPQEHIPKYFGKHGFPDADPKKIKKNGAGRCNWGNLEDELLDEEFNFTNARRRSNSSSIASLENFKTKFEVNEPEPVFEESMGAEEESGSSGTSVDEDKAVHKD